MSQYKIPKLARNKYNFVEGTDGNKYMTVSQYLMGSGRSGGLQSLTSTQVQSQINDTLANRGLPVGYDIVSSYDLKTINGYSLIGEGDIEVTGSGTVDLSAYATKTYVADYVNTYAPTPDLSSYVTKVELDDASYMNAYVLPQNDYDNLSTADKNKNTIYLISDQTAYEYNELVTVQEMNDTINSYGFLTAANFEYDSYTGTLTMRI